MSIVLKDGTVLPDIPSEYEEMCPYAAIVHMTDGSNVLYQCYRFGLPYVAIWFEDIGNYFLTDKAGESAGRAIYYLEEGMDGWGLTSFSESQQLEIALGAYNGVTTTVVWSNCDIMVANYDDGEPTGEIYFPSSISSKFILPDGTELPALPEGCFEKYPYGMISYVESTDGEAAYALSVAEGTYIFAPGSATGEGSDYVISLLPGYRHYRYVVAPTAASGWEQYAESTTQHSGHDFSREDGTIEIRWCNHDILTATAMNDDGTPEIGPDLYRKSDVNYRVYGGWLNSMGNQARRLGGVSGALKPGEMESVFQGVTAGGSGGGITLGSNASGYVPDIPKGYGHSVFELGSIETAAH